MANKTVQALKINASVALNQECRGLILPTLAEGSYAEAGSISRARITFNHAIVARFDDPAYSARVTERIATIKGELLALGELENWYVVAGAAPVEDAEVLPDEPPAEPERAPVDPPSTTDEAAPAKGRKSREQAPA